MSTRPFKPVLVATDQGDGRAAPVLAARDENALIGVAITNQGNPLIPLNETNCEVCIMQKMHSSIKRLHGAATAGRGRIVSAGRVTAGVARFCSQTSGEGRP